MPYIPKDQRKYYDPFIAGLTAKLRDQGWREGHINYIFYSICKEAFQSAPCYSRINMVIGVLGSVAHEFYRRIAVPYEDSAREKNGDI